MEVNALHRLRSAQGILGLRARARPRPARGSLRQGDHRRGPVLPHHQGHPGRRAGNRARAASRRRRWRRRVPARPRPAVRRRHPGRAPDERPGTRAARQPARPQAVRDARRPSTPASPRPPPANSGHLDFLQVLCDDEIARRQAMSMTRRIRRARFDEQATLEGFDFRASPKLPAAQIRDLAALRWLARRRIRDPLRPSRRRQKPHRPGPGPPRHPRRRRRPLHQDQPRPGATWPAATPTAPGTPASASSPARTSSSSTTSPCASSPPARPTTSTN